MFESVERYLWYWETFLLVTFFVTFRSIRLYKINKILGLGLFYCCMSGVWVSLNPVLHHGSLHFRYVSAGLEGLIILLGLSYLIEFDCRRLLKYLIWLGYFNVILIYIHGWGLMGNPSMDNSLSVLLVSLVWGRVWGVLWLLGPVFIYPQSTPFFMLVGVLVGIYWKNIRGLVWLVPVGVLGVILNGDKLLDSTGRSVIWKHAYEFWVSRINIVFGSGTGTFSWLGPYLSEKNTEIFVWLHSEYFQVLFEQGIIGLTLLLSLMITVIYKLNKLRGYPKYLGFSLGLSVMCLTQMPFRWAITQVLITCILSMIFVKKRIL